MKENKTNIYTPAHIANYFLWRGWRENIDITPMKLNQLVYIAYGWNLAINNKKLFSEEIVAWDNGPVILSIYHEFKRFGNKPIPKDNYAANFSIDTGKLISVPIIPNDDYNILKVLNAEWQHYKNININTFRKITNNQNSAWKKALANSNTSLNNKDIRQRSLEAIENIIKKSGLDKYE